MFNKFRFKNKREGSITLETTLLFPLIMFIFFSLIYLTIVLYQDSMMVAESIRAVNRAGAYWNYIDVDSTGKQGEGIIPPPFNSDIEAKDIITKEMIAGRHIYAPLLDILPVMLSINADGAKLIDFTFGIKKDYARQYVDTRIKNIKFKQYLESGNESSSQYYEVQDGGFASTFQNMFLRKEIKVGVNRTYNNILKGSNKQNLGDDSIMADDKKEDIIVRGIISNQVDYKRHFDVIYGLAGYAFDQLDEMQPSNFDPKTLIRGKIAGAVSDKVKIWGDKVAGSIEKFKTEYQNKKNLEKEKERLEKEKADLDKEIKKKQDKINELEKRLQDIDADISNRNVKISDLEENIEEISFAIQLELREQNEKEQLKKELEIKEKEYQEKIDKGEDVDVNTKQLENTRVKIKDSEREIQEKDESISKKRVSIESISFIIEGYRQDNEKDKVEKSNISDEKLYEQGEIDYFKELSNKYEELIKNTEEKISEQ